MDTVAPPPVRSYRLRLGLLLGVVGFLGVASTLLIDMERLIALLPVKVEVKITPGLKALSLVQPTFLVALAVVVGLFANQRTGLRAPVFEALARREPWLALLRRAILPGWLAGGAHACQSG